MLKSIHLVGASLEVGEHHYQYVSSGLCCSSIMFSKSPVSVKSSKQPFHFFRNFTDSLTFTFLFSFFTLDVFSRSTHKKVFPFVFKLLKIILFFFYKFLIFSLILNSYENRTFLKRHKPTFFIFSAKIALSCPHI